MLRHFFEADEGCRDLIASFLRWMPHVNPSKNLNHVNCCLIMTTRRLTAVKMGFGTFPIE